MDRSLRLAKVPEQVLQALGAAGLHTVRDFFSVGEMRLAQLLPWMCVAEVRELVLAVSSHVAPRPHTALQMHERGEAQSFRADRPCATRHGVGPGSRCAIRLYH